MCKDKIPVGKTTYNPDNRRNRCANFSDETYNPDNLRNRFSDRSDWSSGGNRVGTRVERRKPSRNYFASQACMMHGLALAWRLGAVASGGPGAGHVARE